MKVEISSKSTNKYYLRSTILNDTFYPHYIYHIFFLNYYHWLYSSQRKNEKSMKRISPRSLCVRKHTLHNASYILIYLIVFQLILFRSPRRFCSSHSHMIRARVEVQRARDEADVHRISRERTQREKELITAGAFIPRPSLLRGSTRRSKKTVVRLVLRIAVTKIRATRPCQTGGRHWPTLVFVPLGLSFPFHESSHGTNDSGGEEGRGSGATQKAVYCGRHRRFCSRDTC